MSILLTTLLPALLPSFADGLRGIFARITGGKGAQPQNINEVITLMNAETERLKTVAALDSPTGTVHTWVADLRALQRPAIATMIIVAYITAISISAPADTVASLADYVQMVTFYLFGDRAYSYRKAGR